MTRVLSPITVVHRQKNGSRSFLFSSDLEVDAQYDINIDITATLIPFIPIMAKR